MLGYRHVGLELLLYLQYFKCAVKGTEIESVPPSLLQKETGISIFYLGVVCIVQLGRFVLVGEFHLHTDIGHIVLLLLCL